MALSIKNKELEEASRELARVTGKPMTEALLEGTLRELRRQKQIMQYKPQDDFWKALHEIQDRVAKLPILDCRNPDDILYDEYGLPN